MRREWLETACDSIAGDDLCMVPRRQVLNPAGNVSLPGFRLGHDESSRTVAKPNAPSAHHHHDDGLVTRHNG